MRAAPTCESATCFAVKGARWEVGRGGELSGGGNCDCDFTEATPVNGLGASKCVICRSGVGEAHPPMAHGCVGCLGGGDCGMCSMDAGVRAGRLVWEPADALVTVTVTLQRQRPLTGWDHALA